MSLKDSRAVFSDRIRALVVDSDARFLRTATLMLSLLNFLVATCETPASAVKLLDGRLKDADVVFIDALRAATCGFDFRGLVEPHMCIPVIYFFSLDYNVAGDVMAEALRRTVGAATYVLKKPLEAEDFCRLWPIIGWSKFLLRRGEKTLTWTEWPRGNQVLPNAVQALSPSSSTFEGQGEEEDDDNDLFKVVGAGRDRRRKLDGSHKSDEVPSYQQNRTGVHGTDVQNQQHGRSLFMQRNNTMVSMDAAGPSSSNAAAFAGPSNTSAPALLPLPVYQAMGVQNQQHSRPLFMPPVPQMLDAQRNNPVISADAAGPSNISAPALLPAYQALAQARATSPAPHVVYSAPGLPPPVYQQQQQQQQPAARAGKGRPRRKLVNGGQGVGSSGHGHMLLSHHQLAQQNRGGLQAMDIQNQNQHHGWSVFMQRVYQMLNMQRNNPMISMGAAGPSSINATAFAVADTSNISAPALLPAYQARAQARETSLAPHPHVVSSAQAPAPGLPPPMHQQQPVALYDLGNMVTPPVAAVPTMAATRAHQPQFTLNQRQQQQGEDMFAPRRQGSWRRRRRESETGPIMLSFQQPLAADAFFTPMAAGGDTTFGASPTDAGVYGDDVAVAHIESSSVGAQPADSFDDELRGMMEMNDTFPRSYYDNCSAQELLAPATDKLAAPSSGSNYNNGLFRVTDVNGGSSESFMVPQDLTAPTVDQEELGAPDMYGSLAVASPGTSAMFDGNGNMEAMFPSDQYDENAMFSVDALWNFDDDIPMHPEGQQVAAVDCTSSATNATGIMSNAGESGGFSCFPK